MLLTIGQLADHCGVTVRAIRHYHQRGLLSEPARDASGYRRYCAQAVVDLIRIKALAEAGVPLSQVRALLDADAVDFSSAIAEIDGALQQQISTLEQRRDQLAQLLAGDRLVLPTEVVDLLEDLRALGVSEWNIGVERDGWILVAALCPKLVPEWAGDKRAALRDPEFQRLYVACDQAHDWDPDDPRLEQLAARMTEWIQSSGANANSFDQAAEKEPGVSVVESLMTAQLANASPAWRRLAQLSRSQMRE